MAIKLNVPFSKRDEAKALGAKWDPKNKYWYIDDSMRIEPFSKWLEKEIGSLGDIRFHAIALLKSVRECYKCKHDGAVYAVVAKGYDIIGTDLGHAGTYKIFPFVNIASKEFWNHPTVKASTLTVGETMQVQQPHLLCKCPKCKAVHGNAFLHFEPNGIFNFANDLYKYKPVEYIELNGFEREIVARSYLDTSALDLMSNPGFNVFEIRQNGDKKYIKNVN